jgi:O-antigen/teichoic acid export membrane protein
LGKRRLVGNSLAMLSNRLTQSIATFVLTAAIARLLGTAALGQYLLAFSYYFIFVGIVSDGSKALFTRELSRDPKETPVFLVSGTLLQLLLSLIGYGVLVAVVMLLPYSLETTLICSVMGLAVIPFSLSNITEAIFQAQERMHLIAVSTVPFYLLRLLAMLWLMQMGYGVLYISGLFVISEWLILVIQWGLIVPSIRLRWQINRAFMWQLFLACRTFVMIGGIAIISSRIQILLLSLLANEQMIGIYGGIIQLMQPFWIIANSIIMAVFPKLSKVVESGREQQRPIAENCLEILFCAALPFLVGLYFVGGDLLTLVYGPGFESAVVPLRIVALSLLFLPFTRVLSYVLVANGLEKINLYEVIITNTIGTFLGIVLVTHYQLIGAAATDLAIHVIGFLQYTYTVHRRVFRLRFWPVIHRPLLISSAMAGVFLLLQTTQLSFLIVLMLSTLAYCILIGIVGTYALGGHQVLWAKLTARR